MPIYEYHCLECGATFEKIVSLNIGVAGFREVQQFSRRKALLGLLPCKREAPSLLSPRPAAAAPISVVSPGVCQSIELLAQ